MRSRTTALLIVLVGCASCANQLPDSVGSAGSGTSGQSATDPSLSEREKDLVRNQVAAHWAIDPGMEGLEEMVARITVEMNPDGSVQSAEIDPNTNNGHPNWPQFANACLRAVLKSSPLQMRDKPYEAWKQITLIFTARDLLHQ